MADEVADAVVERYRGTTAAVTTQLRRVVRRVTRQVRRRRRDPADGGSDDDDNESVVVSEEQIEDVVACHSAPREPAAPRSGIDPRVFGGLPSEVVREIVVSLKELESQRIAADVAIETKRVEAEAQRFAIEPKRLMAEASLEKARTEHLRVQQRQQQAAAPKRARDDADDAEAELERLVAAPWNNLPSLPAAAAAAAPEVVVAVPPTRELCGAVLAWVQGNTTVRYRVRLLPRFPGLEVVYAKDAAALTQRFWADHTGGARTCAPPPPPPPPPESTLTETVEGAARVVSVAPLYSRDTVRRDIAALRSVNVLWSGIIDRMADCDMAALPRFAAPVPDGKWSRADNWQEIGGLVTLFGITALPPRSNGLLSCVAQRLSAGLRLREGGCLKKYGMLVGFLVV